MSDPAELMFRGVKLGPVTPAADGTFIPFEAPLPVGTLLELGGRALRVTQVVEAEASGGRAGMHVESAEPPADPEPESVSEADREPGGSPRPRRKRR